LTDFLKNLNGGVAEWSKAAVLIALLVLMKNQMRQYIDYAISIYGKDYVTLYDGRATR
jgi:hypothetical protein